MNKLAELRKQRGFTQKQMAKALGIARSTYSGYEIGYFDIPISIALKIKKLLKYNKDDIFQTNKTEKQSKKEAKTK